MTRHLRSSFHHLADLVLNRNLSPLPINYESPSTNKHPNLKLLELFGATLESDVDDCNSSAASRLNSSILTRFTEFRCLRMWTTTKYCTQLRRDINHTVILDIYQLQKPSVPHLSRHQNASLTFPHEFLQQALSTAQHIRIYHQPTQSPHAHRASCAFP